MRKLLLLSFLLIAVLAQARRISADEATSIASEFLNSATVRQASAKAGVCRAKAPNAENADSAPFYVYNADDNNGFVIVSGDDRVQRILGYSNTGNFDFNNLPPQLDDLLGKFAKCLEAMPADSPTHKSWRGTPRSAEAGVLLKTAEWGQGAPYNSLCPIIDGVQAPTGCVATAMAIIMKYHNWPECGRKTHTYWNSYTGQMHSTDFSIFCPKWDAMLPAYKEGEYSEENAKAVAELMLYSGMATNMQYSATESGTGVLGVMTALRRYFNYTAKMDEVIIEQYGIGEWKTRIREDIENNCPVFYYGKGTGAHAFIIDGYADNDFFHINWGWNGSVNGYFTLDNLSSEVGNFSNYQGMVAGIHPATNEDGIWSDFFMADDKYFGPVSPLKKINPSVESIEQNVLFDAVTPCVAFPPQIVCDLGIAIVNKNNVIKQVLSSISYSSEPWDDLSGVMPMFNNLIAQCPIDETDQLQIVVKELGTPDWLLVNDSKDISSSISVRNNVPHTANVRWDIDPRFSLEFYDMSRNVWSGDIVNSIDANDRAGKFLVGGNYQFHPYEADANRGIYSAIRINDVMADIKVNKAFTMGERAIGVISALPEDYNIKIMGLFPGDEKTEKFSIENAGDLGQYISDNKCSYITDFTLSGPGTKDDYKHIRLNMPFIAALNLASYVPEEGKLPDECFAQLPNLSKVILPENVSSIGSRSFIGDALETVVIPQSVKYIGNEAFNNYGGYFDSVNLAAVFCKATTPPEVGDLPFGNNAQTILYVLPGCKNAYAKHPYWSTFKDIIEDGDPIMDIDIIVVDGVQYKIYPTYAEIIGPQKDNCPDEVVLQETVVSNGHSVPVTSIAYNAFLYSTIKKVTVPKSIVNWATGAFACCSALTDVEINAPIKGLPTNTFESCGNLTNIKLPNTIETIGQYAISGAQSIKELMLPSSLKEIQWNGIIGLSNLKKIVLPQDNTNFILEDGVLYSKDMTWLYLYQSGDDSRERFVIPEGVTNTFDWSISGRNLKEVVIPSSMTELTYRFIYPAPNLEFLFLHDNILSIPDNSITLPKHLTLGKNINKFGVQYSRGFDDEYNIYCLNTNPLNNFRGIETSISISVFSGNLFPNIIFGDFLDLEKKHVYIPGEADWSSCNLPADNIHYMWEYKFNTLEKTFNLCNVLPNIEILTVKIDGVDAVKSDDRYLYSGDDVPEIAVEYRVNNHQLMTTVYPAEFNKTLPIEDTSGVIDVVDNPEYNYSVYDIYGVCVARNTTSDLAPGIYIIRQGKSVKKFVIR